MKRVTLICKFVIEVGDTEHEKSARQCQVSS